MSNPKALCVVVLVAGSSLLCLGQGQITSYRAQYPLGSLNTGQGIGTQQDYSVTTLIGTASAPLFGYQRGNSIWQYEDKAAPGNNGQYNFADINRQFPNLASGGPTTGPRPVILLGGMLGSYYTGTGTPPNLGTPPTDPAYRSYLLTPFLNYVKAIVTQYKHKGVIWEIWNEPHDVNFWNSTGNYNGFTNPSEYVDLVKQTCNAIRSVSPDEWIIGLDTSFGSATQTNPVFLPSSDTNIETTFTGTTYDEECIKEGILSPYETATSVSTAYLDAIAIHPYTNDQYYLYPPDVEGSTPWFPGTVDLGLPWLTNQLNGWQQGFHPSTSNTAPVVITEFGANMSGIGSSNLEQMPAPWSGSLSSQPVWYQGLESIMNGRTETNEAPYWQTDFVFRGWLSALSMGVLASTQYDYTAKSAYTAAQSWDMFDDTTGAPLNILTTYKALLYPLSYAVGSQNYTLARRIYLPAPAGGGTDYLLDFAATSGANHFLVGWTTGLTHLVPVSLNGMSTSTLYNASNLTGTTNTNGSSLQLSAEPVFAKVASSSPYLLNALKSSVPMPISVVYGSDTDLVNALQPVFAAIATGGGGSVAVSVHDDPAPTQGQIEGQLPSLAAPAAGTVSGFSNAATLKTIIDNIPCGAGESTPGRILTFQFTLGSETVSQQVHVIPGAVTSGTYGVTATVGGVTLAPDTPENYEATYLLTNNGKTTFNGTATAQCGTGTPQTVMVSVPAGTQQLVQFSTISFTAMMTNKTTCTLVDSSRIYPLNQVASVFPNGEYISRQPDVSVANGWTSGYWAAGANAFISQTAQTNPGFNGSAGPIGEFKVSPTSGGQLWAFLYGPVASASSGTLDGWGCWVLGDNSGNILSGGYCDETTGQIPPTNQLSLHENLNYFVNSIRIDWSGWKFVYFPNTAGTSTSKFIPMLQVLGSSAPVKGSDLWIYGPTVFFH